MYIKKYPLLDLSRFYANLPRGMEILSVSTEGKYPNLHARVNPCAPLIKREFRIVSEMSSIDSGFDYIGSIPYNDGSVRHLFISPE